MTEYRYAVTVDVAGSPKQETVRIAETAADAANQATEGVHRAYWNKGRSGGPVLEFGQFLGTIMLQSMAVGSVSVELEVAP